MSNKKLIDSVEQDGELIDSYMVDESQTVSNAGEAFVYKYKGGKYEIIVWNSRSEQKEGTKTLSKLS